MDIVNLSFGNVSVCDVIDEFRSLKRTQCFFAKKSPNGFQGQAEETLMSQVLCHVAVNVFTAGSEQSL